MSARELRALGIHGKSKDILKTSRRLTRSSARSSMGENSEERIAELEAALEEAQTKFEERTKELERITEDYQLIQQHLKDAEAEMETNKLRAEVERLKAVEKVRDEERERSVSWANDLRERFRSEKQVLEDKVASLEAKLASGATPTSETGSSGTPATTSSSSPSITSSASATSSTAPTTASSVTSSGSSTASALLSTAVTSSSSSMSTAVTSSGSSTSTTDSMTTVMSIGSAEMIKQLFETQSQLFAAQMQAASLPPLSMFEGQGDGDDSEFELWLERFKERAKLAKWTDETKLCQMRLHLSKVAGQAFQMLPKEEKSSYTRAVASLKKRFRSVEIEELKGLEFHRRVQGEESVEQLGMDLQKLGRKAFPSTEGKELDRLLKGRFYQALHPKWQCKLNAPCTDETFEQLFERARMVEQHEKQFSASAACRNKPQTKKKQPVPSSKPAVSQKSHKAPEVASTPAPAPMKGLCHDCGQAGHWARNCPRRSKDKKQQEAPGCSVSEVSRTSCVEAKEKSELTEEELELLLAKCRLQKEQSMLKDTTKEEIACVKMTQKQDTNPAVGPSLFLDLHVEGVPVVSMVDCGSPSTIISRSLLHRVIQQMKRDECTTVR